MNNCKCLVPSGVCVCHDSPVCVYPISRMYVSAGEGWYRLLAAVSRQNHSDFAAEIQSVRPSQQTPWVGVLGRRANQLRKLNGWRICVAPWKTLVSAGKSRWWKMLVTVLLVTVQSYSSTPTQETTKISQRDFINSLQTNQNCDCRSGLEINQITRCRVWWTADQAKGQGSQDW